MLNIAPFKTFQNRGAFLQRVNRGQDAGPGDHRGVGHRLDGLGPGGPQPRLQADGGRHHRRPRRDRPRLPLRLLRLQGDQGKQMHSVFFVFFFRFLEIDG